MLRSKHATIKLNGQDFDGSSGPQTKAPLANIDGVMRPTKPNKTHPIHHLAPHPAPSQTLMRRAVSKPAKSAKLIESISLPLKSPLVASPPMVGRIDPNLAKRARTFRPSREISRFGASLRSADATAFMSAPEPSAASKRAMAIAQPAGASLLERAVINADSHKQPKLSKKELRAQHGRPKMRGRGAAITLVSVMALLVLAYGIYANMPNVMVKVASVRAGFSAVLPSYRPSGYSLTSVGYQPRVVSFNFASNVDNRKFTLTEHSSNWDSATLLSSDIVPSEGSNYQELTIKGQSVYLYGNDQAAWVSSGILYQLSGSNNSLSTNQLLKLATTL